MSMFDPIVSTLSKVLEARTLRHNVITSNLANADTPGYRAQRVEFESAIESATESATGGPDASKLATTASTHLSAGTNGSDVAEVYEPLPDPAATSGDGNTVSRETETARMAENQLLYRASARVVSRHLAMIRYAISEGGR